jgi:hypothetical protein
MDTGFETSLQKLSLDEQGSRGFTQATASQPVDRDAFFDRFHKWSEEATKRNKGALGVSFGPSGVRHSLATSDYWVLTREDYDAGKGKAVLSPKPSHAALSWSLP